MNYILTDTRRLATGIRSGKCVVRRFHRCANVYLHKPRQYIHGSMHHKIILIKMTNEMHLCRIIYYSLAALHVSSDIIAHHQEHLSCNYSFWFHSHVLLSAAVMVKMLLMMSDNIARNM